MKSEPCCYLILNLLCVNACRILNNNNDDNYDINTSLFWELKYKFTWTVLIVFTFFFFWFLEFDLVRKEKERVNSLLQSSKV